MRVLTVNAGSSSLKLALVEGGERSADEEIVAGDHELDRSALERFAKRGFDCSSHRIVHGGPHFTEPVCVDDRVRRSLDGLVDLAPLHTPLALRGIMLFAS